MWARESTYSLEGALERLSVLRHVFDREIIEG